jgi:outer membrane autotransporter protein
VTHVVVVNEGGSGVKTLEGIELIRTGSSSNSAFQQQGRIVTDSYDYHLQQRTASSQNMNKWYLTSKQGTNPSDNPNPNASIPNVPNRPNSSKEIRIIRPESESYANNISRPIFFSTCSSI